MPVTKIFYLPSILARIAGSDMWLGALMSVALDMITLTAILLLWRKFRGAGLYTLLETNVGKGFAKAVFSVYFFYFFIKAYVPFTEQKNFVEVALYENTSNFLIFLPVFAFGAYLAVKKTAVLGRAADMFVFITLIAVVLITALAAPNTDFGAMLPIGINGFGNIAKSSYYALTWFGDAIYFMFLMGEIIPEKRYMAKTLLCYLLAGLFVVLFMVLFYGTFSTIAVRQSFALTEISKYSTVVYNIGRFDYIGLFCILLSSIFSLSLPLYFATYCLQKVFDLKLKVVPAIAVNLAMFILVYSTVRVFSGVQNVIQTYLGGFLLFAGNVLPVLFLLIRRRESEKKILAG